MPILRKLVILTFAAVCGVFAAQETSPPNTITEAEAAAGWKLLFDGKTMNHWEDPRKLNPVGDAWTIEDGCLKSVAKARITEDLVSADKYRDFELQWEWKISPGGNSGVKYRIQALPILTKGTTNPDAKKFEDQVRFAMQKNAYSRSLIPAGGRAQIYVVGFEYQMIDNDRHPDARRGGRYQAGALYDIAAPLSAQSRPIGEFNQSRLVVKGNHVEHWLNGVKVVDTMLDSGAAKEETVKRWGMDSPVYQLLMTQPKKDCPISLQNHDSQAWFRSIKIRRLD